MPASRPTAPRTPMRRCVGCRQAAPKPELIRIVRCADGAILVDAAAPGRGAYLHNAPDCIAAAVAGPRERSRALTRALRQPVPAAVLAALSEQSDIP